jgi:hypothetical protein
MLLQARIGSPGKLKIVAREYDDLWGILSARKKTDES